MRVRISILRERVLALPCEVRWELEDFGCVCVSPLQLGGLRGKNITTIFGWKVAIRRRRIHEVQDWKGNALVVNRRVTPLPLFSSHGSVYLIIYVLQKSMYSSRFEY